MPSKKAPILLVFALLSVQSISIAATKTDPAASKTLVVLDTPSNSIEGPALISILEAYVCDVGVTVELARVEDAPHNHGEWIELAREQGTARNGFAVLWFEPPLGNDEGIDVNLVLLGRHSGAIVILPIDLGTQSTPARLRVLAATTRMMLDTELVDDLLTVVEISKEDPPPEPWAPPEPSNPDSELSPTRQINVYAGYVGNLRVSEPTVLNGALLGGSIRLNPWIGPVLETGYITRSDKNVEDMRIQQHRLLFKLGIAGALSVGSTEALLTAFWNVEMVWVDAEMATRASGDAIDPTNRFDTGGGLELRWRFPIASKLGLFVAASGRGMIVSHDYKRNGLRAVSASPFVLDWSVGLDLAKL
ncbi:MAG: hypothetical protein GY847_11570 [Proteobacteria bacterium]|nr:hypothetical protein [Pseudomonadota bacterium]